LIDVGLVKVNPVEFLILFADTKILEGLYNYDGPRKGRHYSQNKQNQFCDETSTKYQSDYARFA